MHSKSKGYYLKYFDLDLRDLKYNAAQPDRHYRHTWPDPGGHAPFAVEYWYEMDVDLVSEEPEIDKEIILIGTLFIKWRDDLGVFVTQRFPLYGKVRLRKEPRVIYGPDGVTEDFLTPINIMKTVACSNVRVPVSPELCGCRVGKIFMSYDKNYWGCRFCLLTWAGVTQEYQLGDDDTANQWWYDRILGITDGHHEPPEGVRELPDGGESIMISEEEIEIEE